MLEILHIVANATDMVARRPRGPHRDYPQPADKVIMGIRADRPGYGLTNDTLPAARTDLATLDKDIPISDAATAAACNEALEAQHIAVPMV